MSHTVIKSTHVECLHKRTCSLPVYTTGLEFSRLGFRSRDVSRPNFGSLGLGLGLEHCSLGLGLGLEASGRDSILTAA